jgi:hypothetical protein
MEDIQSKQRNKKRTAPMDGQQPVHIVTVGALTAAIYRRQAPSGFSYFAFCLKRGYRSLTTGNQIQSTDFFAENKSDLVAVITEATQWIASESERHKEALQNAA